MPLVFQMTILEFGLRHDVYRLYEDLGSNDGILAAGINYPDFSSTVAIIVRMVKGMKL